MTFSVMTMVKIVNLVPQVAENANQNTEAAVDPAAAVMSSMRFTAHSKIFAIKFAISNSAKRNKMLVLPLSRVDSVITEISLINYKSM
jgi:hypothetical protein